MGTKGCGNIGPQILRNVGTYGCGTIGLWEYRADPPIPTLTYVLNANILSYFSYVNIKAFKL